ncbi:C-5 cytosine methyltransferase DmtA [Aspergillus affinis]|uniref:C-5 cytosine methyltransferase DmtA n=1 Tax=Aspergillus affinis TaxID=1070780 RepID=UPI0022FE83AB|nr:C-5 cytosine methyltransferase DmtA [Aspergillus affinis]KAI9042337.1 C-5 cytosine methyltransferase DmtA [Aspergillus affinis]
MNVHEISDDEFDDDRDDRSVTLDLDPGSESQEVIDLTEDTEFSLTEDDYLTDAEIRRLLGNWRENPSLSTAGHNSYRTVNDRIWVEDILYEKGQSVKLRKQGRYLRIRSVIQYTTGEIYFQGWNMIKTARHRECYMPKGRDWDSELVWVTNEDAAEISIFEVRRFVTIHFTNYCDIASDRHQHQGLFCRLKETLGKGGGSIQYISHHEADEGFRWNTTELRRLWRGGETRPFGQADRFAAKFSQPVTDLTGPDDEVSLLKRRRWYTFGDGFCGAGGVSCGANQAGLEIKWAFDGSQHATESYRLNFDNAECELGRIDHFLTNDEDFQRVDVSHGSPPCQTFSPAHTSVGRHDDANSACIFSCSDLIKTAKPRVHTMEETSGLFDRHKETLNRVILDFLEAGYSVRWGLLYCVDYGVPQNRKRLVIIASGPGELLPQFPDPTHGPRELGLKPFTTINQAIASIPTRAPDHDTQTAYQVPKAPYDGNKQAKTITCGGGENYHPSGRRGFTNRELACLQTFPLGFRFGRIEVRKQIGNAVPPAMARALYAEIIRSPRTFQSRIVSVSRPGASFISRSPLSSANSSTPRTSRFSTMASLQQAAPAAPADKSYDPEIKDMADYIHGYKIDSDLAFDTARLVFLDTLGCGLEALKFKECTKLLGPIVEGTVVPNGTKVFGTPYQLDPVNGAFNIGAMIRWLDYNDCWLAAEWGHPSDNLGGILAVADWVSRTNRAGGNVAGGKIFTIKDVLEAMIKAHEIQGVLALENSYNRVGLDHVVLVKVATTAVVSKMLGLSEKQTADAITQAWVDGQSLRTYRHSPNTMSRKSWAAGDACQRAVNLVLKVQKGESGLHTVLSAPVWGFYDVLFKGNKFKFQRPYGSYVMENVLFKVSYPAEFHSQTAIEAAQIINKKLAAMGKSAKDIKEITNRTHEACVRIIDKQFKPMDNFADRDHCVQYMVATMLAFNRLTANDYTDGSEAATSPLVEKLRQSIRCVEDPKFTQDYHDPTKRTIPNALTVTLNDGTVLEEVVVEAPLGHRLRREEAKPEILDKYKRHLQAHFDQARIDQLVELGQNKSAIENYEVDKYVDLYVTDKIATA